MCRPIRRYPCKSISFHCSQFPGLFSLLQAPFTKATTMDVYPGEIKLHLFGKAGEYPPSFILRIASCPAAEHTSNSERNTTSARSFRIASHTFPACSMEFSSKLFPLPPKEYPLLSARPQKPFTLSETIRIPVSPLSFPFSLS